MRWLTEHRTDRIRHMARGCFTPSPRARDPLLEVLLLLVDRKATCSIQDVKR